MKGFSDRSLFPGLRSASRLSLTVTVLLAGLCGSALAQVTPSEQQVLALSEALRLKSDEGPGLTTGVYYSDWQVESSAIPQWSKACLGRALTPLEFATSSETAESVVLCQLRDQLAAQYEVTGGNEPVAVQRVVSWWRTGDASRYGSGAVAPFAKEVLSLYRQSLTSAGEVAKPTSVQTTFYDRYMSAGYGATRNSEFSQAVAYFQRALDERPKDTFAQNALRDVMRQARADNGQTGGEPRETTPVDSKHWTEVAQNSLGDRTLVGPNSIKPVGKKLGYWEYRAFAGENNAFLPVPMDQPVRSALLYRLVSCEAGTAQTRVMKAYGEAKAELFAKDFGVGAVVEQPKEDSATAKAIAFVCNQAGATEVIEEAPIRIEG